jgi:CBS domain-containing protein
VQALGTRLVMVKARDIMTKGADYIDADASVQQAAQALARQNEGALPVCNAEGRLEGVVTDRDIVVKVIAEGRDPARIKVSALANQPEVVTIGADDSAEEAIETMKRHQVRRLPVIDGHELVGMVSQADIARALPDEKVGDLVGVISS